jgi:hypothetical protein
MSTPSQGNGVPTGPAAQIENPHLVRRVDQPTQLVDLLLGIVHALLGEQHRFEPAP